MQAFQHGSVERGSRIVRAKAEVVTLARSLGLLASQLVMPIASSELRRAIRIDACVHWASSSRGVTTRSASAGIVVLRAMRLRDLVFVT